MRIRKRPQIPPTPSDLTSTQLTAPAAAPESLDGASDVGRGLHPVGGSPVEPPFGYTAHHPLRPFAAAKGEDPPSPDPQPPSRTTQTKGGSHEKSGEAMRGMGEEGVLEEHKPWDVSGRGAVNSFSSSEVNKEKKTMKAGNRNSGASANPTIGTATSTGGVKEDTMGGGDLVEGNDTNTSNGGNGKRRRSPAVLMEGSRCSRVNGRGWRCCQQTLVGYSLCEHHLGKGRLRSVSSVRCSKAKKEKKALSSTSMLSPPQPWLEEGWIHQRQKQYSTRVAAEDEDDGKKSRRRRRRKKKIGIVKARSISSLLDQTNQAGSTTEAPLPPPSTAKAPPSLVLMRNGAMA